MRLKTVREAKGLSLREFAKKLGEDFTLLSRIETGKRYPPKERREKFAEALSLTPDQLEALVAVEHRGLNPYELLPEIPPAHLSNAFIERAAKDVLDRYCRQAKRTTVTLPVPLDDVLAKGCSLSTEYCDFKKEKIPGAASILYGCLFPDGLGGKDRMVFVNTGRIRGRQLSSGEQRTTAAHEAGHYVLHCGNKESAQLFFRFSKEPTFCRKPECEESLFSPLEYQASLFAACLLMPQSQFVRAWQGLSGSIPELRERFEVPEPFVRLRARMLGYE